MMGKYLIFPLILWALKLEAQNKSFEDTCDYILRDVEGKSVKLSAFKGKVVYLDFWASWCKGCKVFFEWGDSLKKKLTRKERKKVVFVYVSADNDENAWKNAVKQWGFKGVHLLSPLNDPKYLGRCFNVTGFPRFMIFDKKGDISSWIAKTTYNCEVLYDLKALLHAK